MKSRYGLTLGLLLLAVLTFRPGLAQPPPTPVYFGADLSYVNEMEDCGAVFQVNGKPTDPYQIFHDYGANLIRLRLWVNPSWSNYSNLDDVIRASQQIKALGMDVMLDFHYSDTWADPGKQIIPAVWADLSEPDLGEALYQYTYDTLRKLDSMGLMPAIVQVGNEINSEILRPENSAGYPINWERNAFLINKAIRGVREAGAESETPPRVMLHIAQPENVEGWFLAATQAGVTDYDMIGISYYPKWSSYSVKTAGNVVNKMRYEFNKDVMIVETGYIWTSDNAPGGMGNDLGADSLEKDYPATPDGQRQFMVDLAQSVLSNGGVGLLAWEPAWVNTNCKTPWGTGSSRENASFFDFHNHNEVLPAITFPQASYTYPVDLKLLFRFNPGQAGDLPNPIYFWGDFTGMGRRPMSLTSNEGFFTVNARLLPGTQIHYGFYSALPMSPDTELLSGDCVDSDGHVALTVPSENTILIHNDNACPHP